jgi:excisionase family DNA binding protein
LDLLVLLVGHFSECGCGRRRQALLYLCFAYLACCKNKIVDLLKANDVARRLAVSRAWVYEAARTGRIPSVRIGGQEGPLRFVPEDIDRWLAEARADWTPAMPGGSSLAARKTEEPPLRTAHHRRRSGKAAAVEQQSLL